MALLSWLRRVSASYLYGGFNAVKFKCIRKTGELEKGRLYDGFKVDRYTAAIYIQDGTAKRVAFVRMQHNSQNKYLVEIKKWN